MAIDDRGAIATGPITVADQGSFFVGLRRAVQPDGIAIQGQMHVQYQIPAQVRHPYPIVMVHGGGGQALDYLGTPDGRPGWATLFLREGYAVYVVDRPGMGRSPYHQELLGSSSPPPTYASMVARFAAPASWQPPYPQARLHSQWPGTGVEGDPALDQFLAGQRGFFGDLVSAQEAMRGAGADLLDRIGPAVLLNHSMGGAFGWVVADARPSLVKGIVAIEPIGPPFADFPGRGSLSWGLTAVPLTYDPPVADPSELRRELRPAPGPDLIDTYQQAEPARRLPHLSGIPVVVVVAEASWMAQFGHGTSAYLAQAGVDVTHFALADVGIHGNGHMMMLERNNAEVAAAIMRWLAMHVSEPASRWRVSDER